MHCPLLSIMYGEDCLLFNIDELHKLKAMHSGLVGCFNLFVLGQHTVQFSHLANRCLYKPYNDCTMPVSPAAWHCCNCKHNNHHHLFLSYYWTRGQREYFKEFNFLYALLDFLFYLLTWMRHFNVEIIIRSIISID